MYADDTIAAITTPPGRGGVGIVRVSGRLAAQIAAAVFARPRSRKTEWRPRYLYHGQILEADGRVLDEGLAVLMRGPHSYTGEDVLELHGHGSPVLLRRILARVLSCGARLADPGEFTKRAFLNGRLDLVQAEAVLDLIRARTPGGAALAVEQLSGSLSSLLAKLRDNLTHLKALLEAQIDFSEEDFTVDSTMVLSVLDNCLLYTINLINTYKHGKMIRDGLRLTIVGKPNVGKSSLLNALLGEERAIVTSIAGTTRDSIEETADFNGIPVVLSDTAGLRAPHQADPVEQLGMQRTAAQIDAADLVVIVVDHSRPLDDEDRRVLQHAKDAPALIVINKVDLPPAISDDDLAWMRSKYRTVAVSAKYGDGLPDLRHLVIAAAEGNSSVDQPGTTLTNLRHVDALTKTANSLHLARESTWEHRPPDLIAVDVQDAIDHIGAITGAITTDDVLDRVFSEFCIGK